MYVCQHSVALKAGSRPPFMYFRYNLLMEIDIYPFLGKRPPRPNAGKRTPQIWDAFELRYGRYAFVAGTAFYSYVTGGFG